MRDRRPPPPARATRRGTQEIEFGKEDAIQRRTLLWSAVAGAAALLVACWAAAGGCGFMTDAATRLANDVVREAGELRGSDQTERTFEHVPVASPEGCDGAYNVEFQESLHHPQGGGSLVVGCKGSENSGRHGYSYSTTYHLNAVRVPVALSVEKATGEAVRITLRKNGGAIELVKIE